MHISLINIYNIIGLIFFIFFSLLEIYLLLSAIKNANAKKHQLNIYVY